MWLRNYSHFRERRVTLMLKVGVTTEETYRRGGSRKENVRSTVNSAKLNFPKI